MPRQICLDTHGPTMALLLLTVAVTVQIRMQYNSYLVFSSCDHR